MNNKIIHSMVMFLFSVVALLFGRLSGAEGETPEDFWEGYGQGSVEEAEGLVKALQAQEGITDIANLQGGGALQPQSLETQLAMLTFSEKHLRLFKDIGVVKAYSTLEEYSVQDGYGQEGGFVDQIQNPEEADPSFRREFAVVKYIRTLWRTADVLQYARTISDAEVKNVQGAMIRAMRIAERTLFFGDDDVIPQSWPGLRKTILTQTTPDHVVDLNGGTLNETLFKQASELIYHNYGMPTDMYVSLATQTQIDSLLFDAGSQRYNQEVVSSGSGLIALGHTVTQMRTSFGNFNFKPDIFVNPESQGVPKIPNPANTKQQIEGATSAKSPATPTFALVVNAPTVADSNWKSTNPVGAVSGTWAYRVSAINQFGKSQAAVSKNDTVLDDGSISVNITPGAGAFPATGYEVYRETLPGNGIFRLVATVTALAAAYEDKNRTIAGTSQSFLIDNTTVGEMRTLALAQLAPMHKVKYAKIAPYDWGTVNFYAVPKYYAPLRFVLFKNIGVSRATKSPVLDL